MPRQFRPRRDLNLERMFETRSEAWERVGLSLEINEREVRRAQRRAAIFLLLLIAVDVAVQVLLSASHEMLVCTGQRIRRCHNVDHVTLLHKWGVAGFSTPVRVVAVILVVATGWGLARSIGRFIGPTFL